MADEDSKSDRLTDLKLRRRVARSGFTKAENRVKDFLARRAEPSEIQVFLEAAKNAQKEERNYTFEIVKLLEKSKHDKETDDSGAIEDRLFDLQALVAKTVELWTREDQTPLQLDVSDATRSNGNHTSSRIRICPPDKIEDGIDWKGFRSWKSTWNNYATVVGLGTKSRVEQLATFWSYWSTSFLQKVEHVIGIPQNTSLDLITILDRIEAHYRAQKNVTVDRFHLFRIRQDENEKFDDFYVRLMESAEEADARRLEYEELILTLIVGGITSEEIRQKIFAKSSVMNLNETKKFCRDQEMSEIESRRLKSKAVVNAKKHRPWVPNKKPFSGRKNESKSKIYSCSSCGWDHKGKSCPASGKSCNICKQLGHFAFKCKSKNKMLRDKSPSKLTRTGAVRIGANSSIIPEPKSKSTIFIKMKIKGTSEESQNVLVHADTGAEISVSGPGILEKFAFKRCDLLQMNDPVHGVNGARIDVWGYMDAVLSLGAVEVIERLYVCGDIGKYDIYISLTACIGLELIPKNFPSQIQ